MSTENIENELQLVYRELDELGLRVKALEDSAMKRIEKNLDIPQYDTEQCTKLFKAVFSDKVEEIENAQMDLIDATLDYLDHNEGYPMNYYDKDTEMREYGKKNYALFCKMKQAADKLNTL